jgi:hypothetical protein
MRLKQFLAERYMDTVTGIEGHRSETFEVFKNPTRKEIKELLDVGYGLRIIADIPKKNIYMASGDIMHRHMLSSTSVKKDVAFDWNDYWDKGFGADHIFMFAVDNNMKNIDSDSLYNLIFVGSQSMKNENKTRIDSLLSNDFTWLKKYQLNSTDVMKYITELRRRLN